MQADPKRRRRKRRKKTPLWLPVAIVILAIALAGLLYLAAAPGKESADAAAPKATDAAPISSLPAETSVHETTTFPAAPVFTEPTFPTAPGTAPVPNPESVSECTHATMVDSNRQDSFHQASCTAPGYSVYVCAACGYEETRPNPGRYPPLGHDISYSPDGSSRCSRCGLVLSSPLPSTAQPARRPVSNSEKY